MSHSYYKIWIHALWATKERTPFIYAAVESKIHEYIAEQFAELDCPAKIINGMPDHIHCLFRLNPQKSVADVIKQVKGSSSHFVNQHDLIADKFAWQTGYSAFSVSESAVGVVYQYIKNQKTHHQKKSFQHEYDEFIRVYGFDANQKA
jgi:REP element-mobilizing transposase RayT